MKTIWIGLAGVVVLAAGCDLYAPDDIECYEVCNGGVGAYPQPLRDPYTGQCDTGWYGEDGSCTQVCDGDPVPVQPVLVPPEQDRSQWPVCDSACNGLSEAQCQDTSGCQAVYLGNEVGGETYYDCWAVGQAPTAAPCEALGALECSQRDDCGNVHYILGESGSLALGAFSACHDEGTTGEPNPWGTCESLGLDCYTMIGTRPDCPDGTEAGVLDCQYTGYCIPAALTCADDSDPGACYHTGDTLCDALPPDCPDGTLVGYVDGCFTGYCIPVDSCEEPPSCVELGTEAQCLSVESCTPYYQGQNCSCDGDACACESYLFQSCS